MRLNENIVICGDRVILVPYREEHVTIYHEWMKSPELLELTASEPLSLDEEYEMQRKWHMDEDKLTFILLVRPAVLPSSTNPILTPAQLSGCQMIGDVNMFLSDGPAEDGECEIMIASRDDQGKGYAGEALRLFLAYATSSLNMPPTHLIARIGRSNTPSIALFKSLGFGISKVVEVFDEVEMRWGHKANQNTDNSSDSFAPISAFDSVNEPRSLGYSIPEGRIGIYDPPNLKS